MKVTITPYNIDVAAADNQIIIYTSGCVTGTTSGGAWGEITGTISDQTDLQAELDAKVDTEAGKGLSANDYTDLEKTNLSNQSGSNTGDQDLSGLQETLVSGTNIKTVNSTSLLGSGDIEISGGSSDSPQTLTFASTMTPVLADGNIITVTMTNDGTMNITSDMTAGQFFMFRKIQDATGTWVLTFAAGYKMSGDVALILTGTGLSIDKIGFRAISATEAEFEFLNYDV